jgi:hypothetical protein
MAPDDDREPPGAPWRPPTEDEIRTRAYELYLERHRYSGGALDDWLEAEAELWMKRSRPGALVRVRRAARRTTRRRK